MNFKNAKKIWLSADAGVNTYADFFAAFDRADRLVIACDGNYSVYINDKFVSFGQFPGYEDLAFCDTLDISRFVNDGENTLRITAHHPGKDTSTYRAQPAFVCFELFCGESSVYASDKDTLCRENPFYESGEAVGMVSGQLGFTFGYDQTRSETATTYSVLVGEGTFFERPIKKLSIGEPTRGSLIRRGGFIDRTSSSVPAERMQNAALENIYLCGKCQLPSANGIELKRPDGADGIFAIIDLGAESAGFISLELEVESECDIFVGWGEHLADLRVRTSIGSRRFAAKYHAKPGRSCFENPLLRLGLRYLQLHIYSDTCKIYNAGIRPTDYPLPEPIPCPIDDLLHQRIYEVSLNTLRLCMHEHYEDCPWREQALYTMDSRNQMLCGYYAFGETEFAAASLRLIAHSLRADNMLELCSPARVSITIPAFSAIFIVQLCEYLERSNDKDTALELLPTAKSIADGFAARLENGLISCFEEKCYWNFYEWQTGLNESRDNGIGYDAPLSAFVSLAFDALYRLCEALGEDGSKYLELRDEVNLAADSFWDEDAGCYATFIRDGERRHYSELANSLLVCCKAAKGEKRGKVLTALKSKRLLPITLSHSIFKYDALALDPSNRELILSDIADVWGKMLYSGATSFWETSDGESAFNNAGSLCHGWSAVPVYIYHILAKK